MQNVILILLLFPPYIKFIVWAVFVVSGIGLLLLYLLPDTRRQNGLPDTPGGVMQLTGVVKDFEANRNGDIDRLVISASDTETGISFPPHTARPVMQAAPKGTTTTIWVHMGPPHGPAGKAPRYQLEQLRVGDAVLYIENIPPPPPAAGKPVELNGTVDSLLTGGRGEITGLIVSGYRIALPPHLALAIAPLLQQGKPIAIKGYERSSSDGFVNINRQPLVKPYRMTIDSTDYLL